MLTLPKEETKSEVRPQGGLEIARVGAPTVTSAILTSAGITGEEGMEDTICPNTKENIIVLNTSKRANADRYAKIRQNIIQGEEHEINA